MTEVTRKDLKTPQFDGKKILHAIYSMEITENFYLFYIQSHIYCPVILVYSVLLLFSACSTPNQEATLFESVPSEKTNINFKNTLTFDPGFNIQRYRNFYNGGGVAVGDVSGDGLSDIFFTGNMVSNRLYLNQGNFTFKDITNQAGVAGRKDWSTGVSLVDINSDDLLDIYVLHSGSGNEDQRRNELFVNNGDLTFTEKAAEYGLDDPGYGIHSVFFDYDGDEDLDMYLVNNSNASIGSFDISKNKREARHEGGGDKLFVNKDGSFQDISEKAGIYGSEIGFGLSASVGDLNRDGWPDIYVANDFFERDYLYINNTDGTFREVLDKQMRSISHASMGTDIADLTNDGWPEIYVADMLPREDQRLKTMTIFKDWKTHKTNISYGYWNQFTRNTLQLNNGDDTFSEVGRLAGVEATDWSWAPLIADYDNNGFSDIFVTNGIRQDITNLDYLNEMHTPDMVRSIVTGNNVDFKRLVDMAPSESIGNMMFAGQGVLKFSNRSEDWGLNKPSFSSGAAWGDLNADGALDLIVSNVDGLPKLYRNRAKNQKPGNNWLMIQLEGEAPNTQAIGAQLEVWANGRLWYREHILQRGYQSSVEPGLHLGLGDVSKIDSLLLRWPDGRVTHRQNVKLPARIQLSQEGASTSVKPAPALLPKNTFKNKGNKWVIDVTDQLGVEWSHRENEYVDFKREPLLVHMRSTEGPALCTGDVDSDGLKDIYIGGARGQAGVLLVQEADGKLDTVYPSAFVQDKGSEDTDCAMFDANGDGSLDLYVTSGGNSFSSGAMALLDRLYFGNGKGGFARSDQMFPSTTSLTSSATVEAEDFDGDGHMDLFVGERLQLFAVGLPARGFLLKGDGNGRFRDVTSKWVPGFSELGMITDATWTDWDLDGRQDLVVVGEWMGVKVFKNTGHRFEDISNKLGLPGKLLGWWNVVHPSDLNGDGRVDLVLGNHGLNSRFNASEDHPVKMWVGDFERNGIITQMLSMPSNGKDYPVTLRHELLEQMPSLKKKYPDYASYGGQTIQDIFTSNQLAEAKLLQASELASIVIWNKPNSAETQRLPPQAQFAPMYGIWSGDLTGDGSPELLMGGNLKEVKPMVGQYNASYGAAISADSLGNFTTWRSEDSGWSIPKSTRNIASLQTSDGSTLLVVARNNESPIFFKIQAQSP